MTSGRIVRGPGTAAAFARGWRGGALVVLAALLSHVSGIANGYVWDDHAIVAGTVQAPLTQDLSASFQASRYFSVTVGRDRRMFEEDLVLGNVRGIVVIPADFTTDYAAGNRPQIQVLVDGSDPNTANFVQNYAQGAVANWERQRQSEMVAAGPPISIEQRFWFNPELTSRNFLVPGSIAIVMTLVGTLLTSLVVAREWERGTMEAMMATPVTSAELLAGKILPDATVSSFGSPNDLAAVKALGIA